MHTQKATGVKGLYNKLCLALITMTNVLPPAAKLAKKKASHTPVTKRLGATKQIKRARGRGQSLGSLSEALQLTAVNGSCVP